MVCVWRPNPKANLRRRCARRKRGQVGPGRSGLGRGPGTGGRGVGLLDFLILSEPVLGSHTCSHTCSHTRRLYHPERVSRVETPPDIAHSNIEHELSDSIQHSRRGAPSGRIARCPRSLVFRTKAKAPAAPSPDSNASDLDPKPRGSGASGAAADYIPDDSLRLRSHLGPHQLR